MEKTVQKKGDCKDTAEERVVIQKQFCGIRNQQIITINSGYSKQCQLFRFLLCLIMIYLVLFNLRILLPQPFQFNYQSHLITFPKYLSKQPIPILNLPHSQCIPCLSSQFYKSTIRISLVISEKEVTVLNYIAFLNLINYQKHFLCTYEGPCSWNSCLVMNMGLKLLNEARIEPPIHEENLRSGGSNTFIFMVDGAKAITSFCRRSFKFLSMLVPPAITMFPQRSFLMSESHLRMDWKVSQWAPRSSFPTILEGWKSAYGHLKA